ncbi:mitochondrial fission regulator 1-like isoform X2 [Clavelina lepadiformis]|uniref:mitochondrial fission regulator 1-like isoform X2 n=1 Tax=Clavelina lepadiformis TaxID=159417 RepID=UPI00404141EB
MMKLSDDNQTSGSNEIDLRAQRSLVRKIGSALPLSSTQRPRFELLPNGARLIGDVRRPIFSLSDICQLVDIPDIFPMYRTSKNDKSQPEEPATCSSVSTTTTSPTSSSSSTSNPSVPQQDVANKISALEDELSMLRAQIAKLVSNQNKPDKQEQPSNLSLSFNSTVTGSGEAFSCSTPIKTVPPPCMPPPPPPPPLPPPPPPPPPMMPAPDRGDSVIDLIRKRKKNKGTATTCVKNPLSMSDVLKDLHKVKLKSISRSPSGTPMGNKKPPRKPDPTDPAAFIAEALRKKFANHHRVSESPENSPNLGLRRTKHAVQDKEWENSPPKFGQHLLKKTTSLNEVPAS